MNRLFSNRINASLAQNRRGMSLIIVLILLLLMSILGVTAAQLSLLSNQATRYQRDFKVAYEGAQAALVDAIMDIESGDRKHLFKIGSDIGYSDKCGSEDDFLGLCNEYDSDMKPVLYKDIDLKNTSNAVPYGHFTGRTFQSGTVGLIPAKPPAYIIQYIEDKTKEIGNELGSPGKKPHGAFYRITAIGYGPNEKVFAIVQGEYSKGE